MSWLERSLQDHVAESALLNFGERPSIEPRPLRPHPSSLCVIMPSKTLAASLADLDDVAPQDDEVHPPRARRSSDASDGSDDEERHEVDRSHYEDVGKSDKRRRANLTEDQTGTLRSGKYAGKPARWADMQEDDSGGEDDEDDSGDEDESDEDESDEELDDEDDEDLDSDMASEAGSSGSSAPSLEPVKTKGKAKQSKSVRFAPNDEDDNAAEPAASSSKQTLSASLANQSRLLSTLRDEAKSDAERGTAIQSDLGLWHRSLENRIRLERVVGGSKGLGKVEPRAYRKLLEEQSRREEEENGGESMTAAAHTSLLASLQDHSDALLQAQAGIVASCLGEDEEESQQRAVLHDVNAAGEKRKRLDGNGDIDEDELRARHSRHVSLLLRFTRDALQPFAASVFDRHSAGASTSAAPDSNKFSSAAPLKAFNQSIHRQVDTAMAGEAGQRLVERTRRFRGAGATAEGGQGAKRIGADETGGEGTAAAADVETFDDSDFYAWLLRSLIESQQHGAGSSASAGPSGSTSSTSSATPLFHPRTNTKTKGIDTRASKGRKLRYEVIEKVANFMPRIESRDGGASARWTEDMVERLFASLPFAAVGGRDDKKGRKAAKVARRDEVQGSDEDEALGAAQPQAAGGELGDLRLFG